MGKICSACNVSKLDTLVHKTRTNLDYATKTSSTDLRNLHIRSYDETYLREILKTYTVNNHSLTVPNIVVFLSEK